MKTLIEAVQNGDFDTAEQWLLGGAPADCSDERSGESALAIAVGRADVAMVRLLLEHGADPNFLETATWPLDTAAGRGYKEILELLLDEDADPDAQDEDGCTPLIGAASGGHLEIVELLLEVGADPRCKDRYGKRPILFAAEKGHTEIVDLLAPLSTAEDRRQAGLMMKLARQESPCGSIQRFFEAAKAGDIQGVKDYLGTGGEVDVMDQAGRTALFWAARRDHLDVVKLLVSRGSDVNHLDALGNSLLVVARTQAESGSYEFLYELASQKSRDRDEQAMKKAVRIARKNGFSKEADLAERKFEELKKRMEKKVATKKAKKKQ